MAEFDIKFYPVEEVLEDKTTQLKKTLIEHGVLKLDARSSSGKLLCAGDKIGFYVNGISQVSDNLVMSFSIKSDGDSVIYVDRIETLLERRNMFEIHNTDGNVSDWSNLCKLLESSTGDKYEGNWEVS